MTVKKELGLVLVLEQFSDRPKAGGTTRKPQSSSKPRSASCGIDCHLLYDTVILSYLVILKVSHHFATEMGLKPAFSQACYKAFAINSHLRKGQGSEY